jgi:A/G-specific adenine glycosylase
MIAAKLISWYKENKRDLPWRNTKDPYRIWLSEIILQQTRVAQGLPYYLKFVEAFPTVQDLAKAPEQKVLKLWQGLGYYSRARNLHAAAKQVVKEYKGVFPDSFEELKQLKGVGDYTAAAISSFCFGKPHAVVDGNVFRVLSRMYSISTPINSTVGKKQFTQLANELLHKKDPGTFNQAIMEFGAQFCVPANPSCETCPLRAHCAAGPTGKAKNFPVKAGKTKITTRYLEYFFISSNNKTYIEKRGTGDIWQGLYQLPVLEFNKPAQKNQVLKRFSTEILSKQGQFEVKRISSIKKHQLSHQKIMARFWQIDLKNAAILERFGRIELKHLKKYPFPVLIGNHLREITTFE